MQLSFMELRVGLDSIGLEILHPIPKKLWLDYGHNREICIVSIDVTIRASVSEP